MSELYFAYGSNMSSRRLRARVPAARSLGSARLADRRLAFNKPGRDGSGRANIVREPGVAVWGVLYEIEVSDWSVLDGFEIGYERVKCDVTSARAEQLSAQVYQWTADTPEITPREWYREYLLEGAREHALPADYVAALERVSLTSADL